MFSWTLKSCQTCLFVLGYVVPDVSKIDITFYIHGSVHRDSILIRSNELQHYACVYLLQNYSIYFGCLSHPSSGLHQTVTAASGTGHITCHSNNLPPAWPNYVTLVQVISRVRAKTFRQRGLILGHAGGRLLLWHVIWPVPEAAVTVWCTPDGCDRHPKHVE